MVDGLEDENMDMEGEWAIPETSKPVLAVDFDGVLNSYASGWVAEDDIPDPPVDGAREFLLTAVEHFKVYIFSSRCTTTRGVNATAQWCAKYFGASLTHRLTFTHEKPPARITLDDRALTFTGVWPTMEELWSFQPWYRNDGKAVPFAAVKAVRTLNRALKADPYAVNRLFSQRAVCNEKLADDPTIQVAMGTVTEGEKEVGKTYDVGVLGLINGIFGVDGNGWGYIAAEMTEGGDIKRFLITPPRKDDNETRI